MKHPPSFVLMLLVIIIIIIINPSYSRASFSSQNDKYSQCSQAFLCGDIGDITYPFYDSETRPEYCGQPGFKVGCLNGTQPVINVSTQTYFLQAFDYASHTITVNTSTDTWDDNACPRSTPVNYTIDDSVLTITPKDEYINFYYGCKEEDLNRSNPGISTNCSAEGPRSGSWVGGYYLTRDMLDHVRDDHDLLDVCMGYVVVPILKAGADLINLIPSVRNVRRALSVGFELEVVAEFGACKACTESGGVCGHDWVASKFVCYCRDPDQDFNCTTPLHHQGSSRHQIIWSIVKVVLIVIAIGIFANIIFARLLYRYYIFWRIQRRYRSAFAPKRYSYSSIKKMTNSFKEKLGEGGYGPVFKGKLEDGNLVAVKLWKQSSGDGQEFLNEVASISRTNHANIVLLLGFCFEGHKQALVYEFMPNGSLEKFVRTTRQDDNNNDINRSLPIQTLFKISIGVARGLQYLHLGCDTRILHFDIKPHNILLDLEFNPKISDFGMARSCTRRKSTISMSAARGTAGYIAPEVFFRNYGGVSHKSDVYSFGMMLLEIVGQRKRNDNVGMVDNSSSELYFPQWIYARLEQEEANFDGDEEDQLLERKMILVGLWCIQTSPMDRPSMSNVVEMLRGRLESLSVPPMPSLSSLPRPSSDEQTDQYCSTELSLTLTL